VTLATIAIPTFNRASLLRRAVSSALAQDYRNVEVVISDNASTDDTMQVCKEIAASDSRVRYLRQPRNIGAVANFGAALAAANGTYFMWLADDDWLDNAYLTDCIARLASGAALVSGRARWFDDAGSVSDEPAITLVASDPVDRVRAYYREVLHNSVFYGVAPTASFRARTPFIDVIGSDWLLVASFAFAGRIETVDTVAINRSTGGASESIQHRTAAVSRAVMRDILSSQTYDGLTWRARIRLACYCGCIIGWRMGIRYPATAAIRRSLGDPAYERIRHIYRRVGSARSRAEIVSSNDDGQAMPIDGSSQRTPEAASET
jgi:glycosyltransferase involved in cell wall biosynthesis